MSHASRCPYCHRAVYTSGTDEMALRAAMLLHMLRCSDKPADLTNEQVATAADQAVATVHSMDN